MQDLVVKGESGFLSVLQEVSGTIQFEDKLTKMESALGESEGKRATLQQTL